MRTVYEYQASVLLSLARSKIVRHPFSLRLHLLDTASLHAKLRSETPDGHVRGWRLRNRAVLFFSEEILITEGQVTRPAYCYAYEQLIPQPDGSDVRFFFRFELENLPPTPQKPQPHLHVAGTHPNAHKIHFPSPLITLADVLALVHHHLL